MTHFFFFLDILRIHNPQRNIFSKNNGKKQQLFDLFSYIFQVSYLKANNFGGAFVWSLDLDDFHGRFCEQGNYPFISHLQELLKSGDQNE